MRAIGPVPRRRNRIVPQPPGTRSFTGSGTVPGHWSPVPRRRNRIVLSQPPGAKRVSPAPAQCGPSDFPDAREQAIRRFFLPSPGKSLLSGTRPPVFYLAAHIPLVCPGPVKGRGSAAPAAKRITHTARGASPGASGFNGVSRGKCAPGQYGPPKAAGRANTGRFQPLCGTRIHAARQSPGRALHLHRRVSAAHRLHTPGSGRREALLQKDPLKIKETEACSLPV